MNNSISKSSKMNKIAARHLGSIFEEIPCEPFSCRECGTTVAVEDVQYTHREKLIRAQLCFKCNYWTEQLNTPLNQLILKGEHFRAKPDETETELVRSALMRGYGGSKFTVIKTDGVTYTTTDLWAQGRIPEIFRKRMPDNCVSILQTPRAPSVDSASATQSQPNK
jgi:hypothetical protein